MKLPSTLVSMMATPLLLSGLFLPLSPVIAQVSSTELIEEAARPGEAPYDTYMRLGYASVDRRNYAAAVEYFHDALFYVPEDREATIAYWNARKALHAQINPSDRTPQESDYDRYMRLGYDETSQRDYQSALINFNRALSERPGDYYATQGVRNVTSYIAAQEGKPLASLDSAVINVADNHHYIGESSYDRYMRLGYAASEEKQYMIAADYFRSALYDRPDDRLATIAFWNMKHNLNQQQTSKQSTLNAKDVYARNMRLGYDATQKHHFQEALNHFEAALTVRPDDKYAVQAIANVSTYVQQGKVN